MLGDFLKNLFLNHVCLSAGQTGGEATRDVPSDAGAAADRGAVPQADHLQAWRWKDEPQWVHEEERRVHQPAGTGQGEVSGQMAKP